MKNLLIFVLLCLLVVDSCSETKSINLGGDGYSFYSKQYENKQVLVSIVTFKTWSELRAEIIRQKLTLINDNSNIVAFSVVESDNQQLCTIYMIDPETEYLPEYIGHEFLHCVYGQFHIDNESNGIE